MYESDRSVSPGASPGADLPVVLRQPAPGGFATLAALRDRGQIALDHRVLRALRQARLMSQQDLADDCWRRNIRVSIATIKRAESGRAVRFRVAREFARCFGVPVEQLLRLPDAVTGSPN